MPAYDGKRALDNIATGEGKRRTGKSGIHLVCDVSSFSSFSSVVTFFPPSAQYREFANYHITSTDEEICCVNTDRGGDVADFASRLTTIQERWFRTRERINLNLIRGFEFLLLICLYHIIFFFFFQADGDFCTKHYFCARVLLLNICIA